MNQIKYWSIGLIAFLISCTLQNRNKPDELCSEMDTDEFKELFLRNNEIEKRGDLSTFYNSDTVFFHDKKIIILESVRIQKVVKITVLDNKLNTTIDSLLFETEYLKTKKIHSSSNINFFWSGNLGRLQVLDTRNENVLIHLVIKKSGEIIIVKDE